MEGDVNSKNSNLNSSLTGHSDCEFLRDTIPHFQDFHNNLPEYIEHGAKPIAQIRPRTGPIFPTGSSTSEKTQSMSSIPAATHVMPLLDGWEKDETIKSPPKAVKNKILFLINNLTELNLNEKCEQLQSIIGTEYWPWFARYLVMKRVSTEFNLHNVYRDLLDSIKFTDLYFYVLRETYQSIAILLRGNKSKEERTLLKNLGHWLGMITLLKNKPIMSEDLNIRSLIIEAYRNGMKDLLYVVPFVAKIMVSCPTSKLSTSSSQTDDVCLSPWSMDILNLLKELHQEPFMKLNIQFEIEVLCNTLNINIKDLKAPGILKMDDFKMDVSLLSSYSTQQSEKQNQQQQHKSHVSTVVVDPNNQLQDISGLFQTQLQIKQSLPSSSPVHQLVDDLNATVWGSPTEQSLQTPKPVMTDLSSSSPTAVTLPTINALEPKFSYQEIDTSNFRTLLVNVSVNNRLPLFQAHPELKLLVICSIEKSIQHLIHSVVDKSIKFTINACEQLIKKDFALDQDERRMRAAAHNMTRNLTSGMAMIITRDCIFDIIDSNLKTAFTTQMKSTKQSRHMEDIIEQASSVLAEDNTELACVFIQKAAVEKALIEIDNKLAPEYEARRQAKMENRRYYDPVMMSLQLTRIPESIRAKPLQAGCLVSQQLGVYEEFSKTIPGFISPSTSTSTSVLQPVGAAVSSQNPPTEFRGGALLPVYDNLFSEISCYFQRLTYSQFFQSSSIYQLAKRVKGLLEAIIVARKSKSEADTIILLEKAVEGLLEGLSAFQRETEIIRYRDVHLNVLKRLIDCRAFDTAWIILKVTRCWIESRPEVKYNVYAVDALIRANLVNMKAFYIDLENSINTVSESKVLAIRFARQLVQIYGSDLDM